jgi:malate synthase
VLIETILSAVEMGVILNEFRDHSGGLNAGRWDYMFSIIKKFRNREEFLLPDRAQVTMTVPFMRAYTELLVKACHRRGAHAIGGMAAFIPSRRDAAVNEAAIARVRDDKKRESRDGFDGTWVAHPDLVPVALEEFDRVLHGRTSQLDRQRPEVEVSSRELLDVRIPGSSVTKDGVRNNVGVALRYLESWLRGTGAAGINNLMEDVATAEIARSQIWQWVHHGVRVGERPLDQSGVRKIVDGELTKLREEMGTRAFDASHFQDAHEIFERVALDSSFVEFLTLPAYELLE